jgi:hypothetical protein
MDLFKKKNNVTSDPPTSNKINLIGGVMVSVLVSKAVDHGFKSWSGQTKDYEIGIYLLLLH